ncbi:aminoglycoside 6'-N-acetyltransferase [Paratissierella segnis]|jgi:GNAT superfamily N-acetyltransferase|uniref:Aminoglycoside N(6')-acetyltransferase type 1 n=1 Tax=Paratissierella segnis TaxID=2763679 RepID=A0A926EXM2_9FIRM|nr:aminoglycoside 6'-N-acetyltransferase [Paratissierella segnis]MBC8589427.1 GNAT family N-acetyltransferase [Paratissierella segnis]
MINIVRASDENIDELSQMALDLWPENDLDDLKRDFEYILGHLSDKVFLAKVDDEYIGFIHMSIRKDYVEGSASSPVGYIEGLFVKPEYRRKGVGSELYNAGVDWVKKKGCSEIGTDCTIRNNVSFEFLIDMGFEETNKMICFIKDI